MSIEAIKSKFYGMEGIASPEQILLHEVDILAEAIYNNEEERKMLLRRLEQLWENKKARDNKARSASV